MTWPWRLGVFVAALSFTGLTALLIPLSDLFAVVPDQAVEYRTVDVTEWHPPLPSPPPPPPPKPEATPDEPPPEQAIQPPLPVRVETPPPRLRLPIALDFSLSDFRTDLTLDFDVDADVEVIPELAKASFSPASSPPAAPAPPAPVHRELDRRPTVLSQVRPVYPYRARTRRVEGYVDLEFTVTVAGRVEKISAVNASPKGFFENAAVAAVTRWRFSPGIRDSQPVDARMRIRIRFTLDQ